MRRRGCRICRRWRFGAPADASPAAGTGKICDGLAGSAPAGLPWAWPDDPTVVRSLGAIETRWRRNWPAVVALGRRDPRSVSTISMRDAATDGWVSLDSLTIANACCIGIITARVGYRAATDVTEDKGAQATVAFWPLQHLRGAARSLHRRTETTGTPCCVLTGRRYLPTLQRFGIAVARRGGLLSRSGPVAWSSRPLIRWQWAPWGWTLAAVLLFARRGCVGSAGLSVWNRWVTGCVGWFSDQMFPAVAGGRDIWPTTKKILYDDPSSG